MVLSKAELVDMVKSLFSEDRKVSRMIVELLLAGKSRITFDEILSIARNIKKRKRREHCCRINSGHGGMEAYVTSENEA